MMTTESALARPPGAGRTPRVPDKKIRRNYELPRELNGRLLKFCIRHNLSINGAVNRLIEEGLDRDDRTTSHG